MKKLLQSLFILMFVAGAAFAQDRTVTGTVTGKEDGKPLPGVTVRIKGGQGGTQTKANGQYSLVVPSSATSLEFSYLGYISQSVAIKVNVVNVALSEDTQGLNEVVVVGYGTRQAKDVNGAIGRVSGDKIKDSPTSFDNALSGKTAGVQISSAGGTLGDGVSIRVRGTGSISTSSLPLIVIDGIPANTRENLNVFNSGNGTRFNPLALMNPNDIESIEVLKDAGAAVLYGSRAANGVILVTTKKGKKGTAKISFDSKSSWATASSLPKLLNGDDFITINNEKVINRYGAANAPIVAVNSDVDGDGQPDRTDWMKEIYSTGFTHDNSLAVSGGSDKATFYGSVRYSDQKGISFGNRLRTGSARVNVDVTPAKWIRSGIELSYTKSLNNGILTDSYLAGSAVSGWNAFPTVSARNPNVSAGEMGYNLAAGYLGLGKNITSPSIIIAGKPTVVNLIGNRIYNPLAAVALQRNENTPQNIIANAYVEIQPVAGLKITSKYGIDYQSNFEDQYSNPLIAGLGSAYLGLVQDNILNRDQWVWQNYMSYDKTFATKHKISLIAGAEYQHTKERQIFAMASNFADQFFTNIIDGVYTSADPDTDETMLSSGGTLFTNGLESYFGRAGYTFDEKYYLEGAFRADAFSGFGIKNRWGYFPSVSAGWVASKESFLVDNTNINYLKIRGSYGLVGNSRGVGSYAARTLYSGGTYANLNGFSSSQLGNADLKWEASKKFNIGFDANIVNNRIGVIFDYFNTNISDLILDAPALYTVGIPRSTITTNIGSMKNSGFEITLNTTNIKTEDFSWSTSFNYTHVKNRVTALIAANNNADITAASTVASVGRALGTYKLLNWAGVDPKTGNPSWYNKDGILKIYDFNTQQYLLADGTVTTAPTAADNVYQEGKAGTPTFYGGFDNTFTYKDFDLNLSFVYQGGNYLYNSTRSAMLVNTFQNNITEILDRWTTPGQVTDIPRLWSGNSTANNASTRFLEKGDFIRLRNVSLGYTIKSEWAQKAGMSSLRIGAQVFNAFVITKYSGIDPEVNSNRNNSNISTGYDNRAIPQPRTFMLSLNASF